MKFYAITLSVLFYSCAEKFTTSDIPIVDSVPPSWNAPLIDSSNVIGKWWDAFDDSSFIISRWVRRNIAPDKRRKMNIAGGIDLGGTKIEAQRFDQNWNIGEKRRIDTPKNLSRAFKRHGRAHHLAERRRYPSSQLVWQQPVLSIQPLGSRLPPTSQAMGKKFHRDLEAECNAAITLINDCRAFVQAEARFGSGSQTGCMLGIVLGTGIGGAIAINGCLVNNGHGQSGEFGHLPMPAETVEQT